MPARRGATPIIDIRRGNTVINEVRRGSTPVWSRTALLLRDDFNREDSNDLGSDWAVGPSLGAHGLGVENGYARVKIPDGKIGGFFDLCTSRYRYTAATNAGDDGFIECRMATKGDGFSLTSGAIGFNSQILARCNTAMTHGVGIEMASGFCWIVARANFIDARVADGGTFQAGDVLRLTFVNRNFVLYRNGTQLVTWNDTFPLTEKGSSFRSLSIRGDAGKDLLGPRRFSPAFDYVEMG